MRSITKRSLRRSSRNRNSVKRSKTKRGGGSPTFAAKVGAFVLEALPANSKIQWSERSGFMGDKRVTGVLPFLHLNITEAQMRAQFNSSSGQIKAVTGMCNKKSLNKTLSKVNFNCQRQSARGVVSLGEGVIDSINNAWNRRTNGRKHLAVIQKHMETQVKKGIIPSASIQWSK